MCNYTQVEYRCGHVRYTVRAWCTNYETTHKRCPPSVVAIEFRLDEQCGVLRLPSPCYQPNMAQDMIVSVLVVVVVVVQMGGF
ncbi:hypothetical protein LSUB1_G003631, partial [Lachnellula subtilissima]